ncbi:TIR domain-containing protein [Actinomycetospora aeridis]|uniref:TIR domain-containing protein n=1 Tax=Actinomycetospora aeridis TaxID=3129231 RepID=A0ABU8N7T3_9PSEU
MARSSERFDVFLSYAREDEKQARALELGLQRLARPWYRVQALHVFRDRTHMVAGGSLDAELLERLERSSWLVLLASPDAVSSEWVPLELQWWYDHHRRRDGEIERLIIVRTDGEFRAGPTGIDWSATTCLPEVLRDALPSTPIWAELPRPLLAQHDVQRAVDAALRRRRSTERDDADVLRDALLDVAAPVHDVPRPQMEGVHRRRRRTTWATVAGAALLVVALLLTVVVVAGRADEQRRATAAAGLLQQAASLRAGDPRTALALGAAADALHSSPATRAGLVTTMTASPYRGQASGEALAFAPDRPIAATVDGGVTILWDVSLPGPARRLGATTPDTRHDAVNVTFAPVGPLLAITTATGSVELVDLTRPAGAVPLGRTPDIREPSSAPVPVAFTPDGRGVVLVPEGGSPVIWHVDGDTLRADPALPGPPTATPPLPAPFASIAVSSGGLLALADGPAVALWDLPTRRRLPGIPARGGDDVSALALSPRGLLAVSGSSGTTLWDLHAPATPQPLSDMDAEDGVVTAVALSRDGTTMVAGSVNGSTRVWDLHRPRSPTPVGPLNRGRTEAVRTVAISADGAIVASSGDDRRSLLWNARDPALPVATSPPVLGNDIGADTGEQFQRTPDLAADSDGTTTAVSDTAGVVSLVDVTARTPPRPVPVDQTAIDLAITPDGRQLAVAGDTDIAVWDTTRLTVAPMRTGEQGVPEVGAPAAVAISRDGRLLAAAFDNGDAQLFDIVTGRPVGPPITGRDVAVVGFVPDGRTLVLGSYTGETSLYDVDPRGRTTPADAPLPGPPEFRNAVDAVAFSPDSATLATVSQNGTAVVWDVRDRDRPTVVGVPLGATAGTELTDVTFSRDGTLLLTLGSDSTIRVLDVTDLGTPVPIGQPVAVTALGPGALTALADGDTVIAGGGPGGLALIDLRPMLDLRDSARERACAISGGGLSRAEWARYLPDVDYLDSCHE